ncbi:hypothetical protein GCM10009844_18900 [Nocardioides koreensis]|uniref:NUDIX hydrolase n=1 Tax=Nocardioides koreensis TaxID=433651 RepID=A0ABN2ZNG1_9ACTN
MPDEFAIPEEQLTEVHVAGRRLLCLVCGYVHTFLGGALDWRVPASEQD